MFDSERLDPQSQQVAHELFRQRPELRRFARAEPRAGSGAHYLVLAVRAPGPPHATFVVDTGEHERIALRFGAWSKEFWSPESSGRTSQLLEALSLVEDVLSERAAVYVVYSGQRFVRSGVLYAPHERARLAAALKPGERASIASFQCSLSGELPAQPAP